MAKGIKITQYVYKDDGTDATIADAHDLFGAFVVACRDRDLCSGGEVRLADGEGVVLAGGFRSGRGGPFVETPPRPAPVVRPPIPGAHKRPRRPSPYKWVYRGMAVEELSGDEAREALRAMLEVT